MKFRPSFTLGLAFGKWAFPALWSIVLFAIATTTAAGQRDTVPQTTAPKRVTIINSATFDYERQGRDEIKKLSGNVILGQDNMLLYCDSAIIENDIRVFALGREVLIQQGDSLAAFADTLYYDAILKQAELRGNVSLINGTRKLFTDKLIYDLTTKVATYNTPGVLSDGETLLRSQRGYYYTETDEVYFKDSVTVTHPEFQLKADTLRFNTKTQLVTFLGPTVMRSDSASIYCEAGFYEVNNRWAEFRENAQYERGQQRATADAIRYDGTKGTYTLDGNADFREGTKREARAGIIRYDTRADVTELLGDAYFRDSLRVIQGEEIRYDAKKKTYATLGRSRIADPPQILEADKVDYDDLGGLALANGNVIWQDTSANLTILCAQAAYNQNTGYLKASGGNRGRPLLKTLVDSDTLYMAADTLLSFKPDTLSNDSSRLLLAYHDVRLYKSDMQGLCDSLTYSSVDSLFNLFSNPIIWVDTSQFIADTMRLALANQKLSKIFLRSRAYIINSPDMLYFNQIKGKTITASFVENDLRRMDVVGNAEALYYPQDDKKAYVGVNKTACSEMSLFFAENTVKRILFLTQVEGKLEPMAAVDHEAIKLEGFHWETTARPKSVDDLFTPPVARQLLPPSPAAAAARQNNAPPPPKSGGPAKKEN